MEECGLEALGILALHTPGASEHERFVGALVLAQHARDLHIIRLGLEGGSE